MKKLLTTLLILSSLFIVVNSSEANVYYRFVLEESDMVNYDGTRHSQYTGIMTYGDSVDRQRYNILDFDLTEDNVHLITISAYQDYRWGMLTLEGMINRFQSENPNIEVLGGINGDFYDIRNTGHPNNLFVENYEVIRGAVTNNNPSLIIKEDGSVEIGNSKANGYEILIYNENNEVVFREKLQGINVMPTGTNTTVLTSNFNGEIDGNIDQALINASILRHIGNALEFSKGVLSQDEFSGDEITTRDFLVLGKLASEINENHTVSVQPYHAALSDVRGVMGGNRILINNGNLIEDTDPYKHPRTAVGIREDGSVFFFHNDGRNEAEEIFGMRYVEMARILRSHGAVHAINLDGGGSSTMMARNEDGTFQVLNRLSDGNMRSVSNGILIVRGDIDERPLHFLDGDDRGVFSTPENLRVGIDNVLRFDEVPGANRYLVSIDGFEYETSKNEFRLNRLLPRDYEIKVAVKGNYNNKKSEFSQPINYLIQERTTLELIEWLRSYTKNNN